MAGGKETPRQKMIGMMYLVLTALLALNVSKSILDAFVAIEENTQKSNIIQYERGNAFIQKVNNEFSATKNEKENRSKIKKLKFVQQKMREIDDLASEMIMSIDKIKLNLLKKSGEDIERAQFLEENSILWSEFDIKNKTLPIRMNLMAVEGKDEYDTPMSLLVGEDIKKPNDYGMKLWNDFRNFRENIVDVCGTYELNNQKYEVKTKSINTFASNKDLISKVEKMIDASPRLNKQEDRQFLINLYLGLTKRERNKVHDIDGVHWVGQTFDHAPLVAAIASLSSLQQDILSARALALSHWESKVSTGEFSFNRIIPLVYGPSVINQGDSLYLEFMMGAFNSEENPRVTINGMDDANIFYPKNGKGIGKLKIGNNSTTLTGKIAVKNKNGIWKEKEWSHDVIVMKPSGSIELPKMNVLYREYDNIVRATASGFDETILTGGNVNIRKNGDEYLIRPIGRSRTAYLSVKGKNNRTGEVRELRRTTFRVSNMPNAELFWGSVPDGGRANRNEKRIFARYPPEIPLDAQFTIVSWEVNITGAPGRPPKGSGKYLSEEAMNLIGQVRNGGTVSITIRYKLVGGNTIRKRSASFKI